MKKLSIFRKLMLFVLLLLFSVSPIFSGCFLEVKSYKVATPQIALHSSSQCITWKSVSLAKSYEIYCNDSIVDTVFANSALSSFVYDFSEDLDEYGDYEFYIVAIAITNIKENSSPSNVVVFEYQERALNTPINQTNNVEVGKTSIFFSITGGKVQYIPIPNEQVDYYELYLYSQSTGLNIYKADESILDRTGGYYSINLLGSTFNLKNEIYAIRMGIVVDNVHIIRSDIQYLNPAVASPFTDEIYVFDGYINDMYIQSLQELRNLMYYSFIHRIGYHQVKLSSEFLTLIENYSSSQMDTTTRKLRNAVADSLDYFLETRDAYSYEIMEVDTKNNIYKIKIDYTSEELLNAEGKPEPELTLTPDCLDGYRGETYYEEIDWLGYYDTCGLTMRKDDSKYQQNPYDDFISDHQFLEVEVESSEELYWAVENKVTPIVKKGSRAEEIYNIAKTTLNSIISDEMTDYEKVLSIFDWICINTNYDYYSLNDGCYDGAPGTLTPVYYLEGVFMTGYAVCDGFSKAFSLLCNMEGVDAIRITGTARGYDQYGREIWGGHAWNKVLLDKDPTDNIPASYYVVDVTWTTHISLTDQEVGTHEYFLVGDKDIVTTHKDHEKRTKFTNYKAPTNYNYYDITKFVFDASTISEIAGVAETEDDVYDVIISSKDEFKTLFYYMLVSGLETMEVVVEYDFIVNNHKEFINNGGKNNILLSLYENQINTLWATMKECKFAQQLLVVNRNNWEPFVYNQEGDAGVLIVFEQELCIDADKEAGHLVHFLANYDIYHEYELLVTEEMLMSVSEDDSLTELERVQMLFAEALDKYDVSITFEQYQTIEDSGGDKEAGFIIVVAPKA